MTATGRIENKEKRISQHNNKIPSVRIEKKGAGLVVCQQCMCSQMWLQSVEDNLYIKKWMRS